MTHFSLRFLAEFFKESQGVDDGWPYHLNMGHALSLPIVLVCAFMIFATKRFSILAPLTAEEQAERDAVEKDWLARGGPGGSAEPLPEGAAKSADAKDDGDESADDEAKSEARPRKKGKKGGKPRRAET
jgi:hypothetical protein